MRFMVIVKATKDSENEGALPDPQLMADMNKFNDELLEAGVLLGYDGLHPSSKGARVHFSGKNRTVIDGPFAESKELIAGFWFWQVKSLEEAIEWVKRCPNPHEGRHRHRDPPDLGARRLRICLQRRGNSEGKKLPRSNGSSSSQEIVPLALTYPN
jgi:hypothetical protein